MSEYLSIFLVLRLYSYCGFGIGFFFNVFGFRVLGFFGCYIRTFVVMAILYIKSILYIKFGRDGSSGIYGRRIDDVIKVSLVLDEVVSYFDILE